MMDRINDPKPKLLQLFCKHDAEWYRKVEKFHNLSGERQYRICKKCGKILDTRFIPTEEAMRI